MENAIAYFRENGGLNQAELARRVGTSRAQIGRLESGKRELTKPWAERIAKALGGNVAAWEIMFPELIGPGSTQPQAANSKVAPLLAVSPVARIMMAASEMAGGEEPAAMWFRHQPIPGWADKKACDLVREGKAEKVLDYLEAVRSGVYA